MENFFSCHVTNVAKKCTACNETKLATIPSPKNSLSEQSSASPRSAQLNSLSKSWNELSALFRHFSWWPAWTRPDVGDLFRAFSSVSHLFLLQFKRGGKRYQIEKHAQQQAKQWFNLRVENSNFNHHFPRNDNKALGIQSLTPLSPATTGCSAVIRDWGWSHFPTDWPRFFKLQNVRYRLPSLSDKA